MLIIKNDLIKIGVETDIEQCKLQEALNTNFPRRYIPDYDVVVDDVSELDVYIKWYNSISGFTVENIEFTHSMERYVIKSPIPQPYTNESPVFFLLQVMTRALARRGYIVFTDTVAISIDGKVVLLMGYPHTGKSTLTALSIAYGDIPLTTENTIVKVDDDGVKLIGGTPILVYDPRVEEIFNVRIGYDEKTKHGYNVIDLNKRISIRREILESKPLIHSIYILHCSYRSEDADSELVKGRKIKKTLWYFASSIVKGVDYYEPHPLNLADSKLEEKLSRDIDVIAEKYDNRIFEVFGRHDQVYRLIRDKVKEL